MKKILSIFMAITILVLAGAGCGAETDNKTGQFTLTMEIGNPSMTVNGEEQEIDKGRGTSPVLLNDRTLVPIRAIIEAMGGAVHWEQDTQNVILALGEDIIILTIDRATAYVNSQAKTLDVPPAVINGRTMLPIRFISENLGYAVEWNGAQQLITIHSGL